jgi:hypothetical protein
MVQMRYDAIPVLPSGFEILFEIKADALLNDIVFEKRRRQSGIA